MNKILFQIALMLLPAAARAEEARIQPEDDLFQGAAQIYQQASLDKAAAIEAFERFLDRYSKSSKAADAQFMIGEAHMARALELIKAERSSKRASAARMLGPKNATADSEMQKAADAFDKVIRRYSKTGLESSAQYRLGEIQYDKGDWEAAIKAFKTVESKYPKSYMVPESLLGIVYADIAMNRYADAESAFFLLVETYPNYIKDPGVVFAKGILALNRGDYASAEKSFSAVNTPQSHFYLGRSYMYHGKPYLAASVFEKLVLSYPDSDVREEAEFLIGDAFFRAKDFEGAVSKYQRFVAKYPESVLKIAAVFRMGACMFNRRDYVNARSYFQSILDKNPMDYFAPLAQYFTAESYLANGEYRDALFGYTRVVTQYPGTPSVAPLAHYKLAWCQYNVGDYSQSVQTSQSFLTLYPAHELSKNVYLLAGNCLLAQKKYAEAIQSFQSVIDLSPSSETAEQALFLILKTQYEMKNYSAILTSYQFIFKRLPPSQSKWRSLSYLYAAEAYLAMNLVDEAQTIYDMIIRVYPNEATAIYAQDGLAWCYAYKGEYEPAVKARERLKEMISASVSSFTLVSINALAIADSMFNQKDYEQAYQMYEKFANENTVPEYSALALYRAGLSLYHLRYYTQAVETWQKLSSRYPAAKETENADYQIADTYFRAQKYAESVAAYRKTIEKYPKSRQLSLSYLRIAQAAYNAKNDAETVTQAKEVLKNFPDSAEAVDALDLLEAVFDRSPAMDFKAVLGEVIAAGQGTQTAGEAQFRLGRRYFEKKDYAHAIEELKKFSVEYTAHPSLSKSQFYLGEAYFQSNKYEEAAAAFERLVHNYPEAEETQLALFRLGSANYNLKNYAPAAEAYQRLLDAYPDSEYAKPALFNLALSYKSTGKADLAQETYRRYYELAGNDAGGQAAMWEIFNLQKARGDLNGALKTLGQISEASQGTEESLEPLYRRGEIYMEYKQTEEAKDSWEKLVPMKPLKNPYRLQALIKLGELYEKENNYPAAAALYEDLARNASAADVAGAARERAAALRKMKPPRDKQTDGESAPGDSTQVEQPEPAPQVKKKIKPQRDELPGMRRKVKKPARENPAEEAPGENR